MTRSLPGAPAPQLATGGWASRLQSAATTVGLKVIPWVPDPRQTAALRGPRGHHRRQHAGPHPAAGPGRAAHVRAQRSGPGAGRRRLTGTDARDDAGLCRPADPCRRQRRVDSRTCRPDPRPSLPPGDIRPGALGRLLPRRRLGDRRPRHPRPAVPADLPGRRRPRAVDRLPSGPRTPGAGRGRGRLCGVQMGARTRSRARRDPRQSGGRRRQRRWQPGGRGVASWRATRAAHSRCCSGCSTRAPTSPRRPGR